MKSSFHEWHHMPFSPLPSSNFTSLPFAHHLVPHLTSCPQTVVSRPQQLYDSTSLSSEFSVAAIFLQRPSYLLRKARRPRENLYAHPRNRRNCARTWGTSLGDIVRASESSISCARRGTRQTINIQRALEDTKVAGQRAWKRRQHVVEADREADVHHQPLCWLSSDWGQSAADGAVR